MSARNWDDLSEAEKVEATLARWRAGHTSVANHQRIIREDARAQAFEEACDWLKANGFLAASDALEAAVFEAPAGSA